MKRLRAPVRHPLFWILIASLPLGFGLVGWQIWLYYHPGDAQPGSLPLPLRLTEEPEPALEFDYPLDPVRFGPLVPYESTPLNIDTRFGVQNLGLGRSLKCFANVEGERLPFCELYHAGEDWFRLTRGGSISWRKAAGEPVRAVANGLVTWTQSLGSEGAVIVVRHQLPDEEPLWSVYWHLAEVQVAVGEAVVMGEVLGLIHDRGFNSHLHWELRRFGDGSALFPADSAGGRGSCNGYVQGVGYTWDDDPKRARPKAWGYLEPTAFIAARRSIETSFEE